MQLAAVNARYDQLHKKEPYHDGTFTIWQAERSQLTPFHYREGVSIWISRHDLTPDDDFLQQAPVDLLAPAPSSVPEQAPGQEN